MPASLGPPPIALVSLSIQNFRGIESLDLDFRGPDGHPNRLVVLAGPNGCGKTATLEAGLILAGGSRLVVGQRGKLAIRRDADDYRLQGEFAMRSSNFDPIVRISVSSRSLAQNPSTPIPHWYFSSWRVPNLIGPVDVTVGRPGRKPAKNDVNRLLNVKQQLANLAAVERFRPRQISLISPYTLTITSINEAWREFYPESNDVFFVDLASSGEAKGGSFDVFLGSPEGARLEVDCLSTGQIELFLFLSALALNENREGLVFIDEPELHLDPQWHRPIIRSLMRLQFHAQFIVATHSPEIYDAARSYERHFLVPEDDPRSRLWSEVRGAEAGT